MEPTSAGTSQRFALGTTASVAYVLAFVIYVLNQRNAMLAMKPEQFGEFLGGVFAPLAFMWLVLGYLQQGDELRTSSEALRLQEEELHSLVEQQTAMVAVTREQFEHEKRRAEAAEKESRRLTDAEHFRLAWFRSIAIPAARSHWKVHQRSELFDTSSRLL